MMRGFLELAASVAARGAGKRKSLLPAAACVNSTRMFTACHVRFGGSLLPFSSAGPPSGTGHARALCGPADGTTRARTCAVWMLE